jgi:putative ABC transport system ATP-binding protein
MSMLDAQALTKSYRRGTSAFLAVDTVSFTLREADFVCVTGHSGSGKSTLLNMIAGLLPPDSGQVIFEGQHLTALDDEALSRLRNDKIGYIPQGHSILANFNVLDNVRLPYYLNGRRAGDPTKRALELLEQMGVAHLAQQYPAQLSGGELRRVAIARGLINAPRLLIADEPTGDLDPGSAAEVMDLFAAAARNGTAVFLVTHDLQNLRHTQLHWRMEAGRLTKDAPQ